MVDPELGGITETRAGAGDDAAPPLKRSRSPRPLARSRDTLYPALSLAIGIGLWELCARLLDVRYVPTFVGSMGRLIRLVRDGQILSDAAQSVQNLVYGFLISAGVGLLLGLLMGRYRLVERALEPYVYTVLTAPTIVFAPVYFSIFGLSPSAIVALIVQYSIAVIILNTATGVRAASVSLIEMATSFGASENQITRRIVLPAAVPMMMAGLRLGMGRAVKGMINGELFIAVVGLGATSRRYGRVFDSEGVIAIVFAVLIIALVAVKVVQVLDERVTRWVPRQQ